MAETEVRQKDALLALACWSTLLLSLVSLVAAGAYLLAVPALARLHGALALLPLMLAMVPWLYLDILWRERRSPGRQHPLWWLILSLVAGMAALAVVLVYAFYMGTIFGPSPVLALGLLIGALAFWVVARILVAKTRLHGPN